MSFLYVESKMERVFGGHSQTEKNHYHLVETTENVMDLCFDFWYWSLNLSQWRRGYLTLIPLQQGDERSCKLPQARNDSLKSLVFRTMTKRYNLAAGCSYHPQAQLDSSFYRHSANFCDKSHTWKMISIIQRPIFHHQRELASAKLFAAAFLESSRMITFMCTMKTDMKSFFDAVGMSQPWQRVS